MKKALAAPVVFLLAALALPSALADQAADREAIDALMWRYARALDTLDAQGYAATYTQDGKFMAGGTVIEGRDALREYIEGLQESMGETPDPAMYHMTTDAWTEFVDETHARHHTYWMTVFGPAEQGESPRVAAAGRGVDDLVKVDGEWLIQTRNVSPQE